MNVYLVIGDSKEDRARLFLLVLNGQLGGNGNNWKYRKYFFLLYK